MPLVPMVPVVQGITLTNSLSVEHSLASNPMHFEYNRRRSQAKILVKDYIAETKDSEDVERCLSTLRSSRGLSKVCAMGICILETSMMLLNTCKESGCTAK